MDAPTTKNLPATAVALKVIAVFLFTCMAALIKAATENVPAGEALFFRTFFSIPVILIWLWSRNELREGLIPKRLSSHILRGIFGTTAMGMTFGGLMLLPLPEVTAIGYATPIFTVILAALFLGERIRMFRISAVALGLVGVLIVMWPRLSVDDLSDAATIGALLVLGASIMRALVQIFIRQMVQTEHTAAIVFWFMTTATVISLTTIPFGWVMPTTSDAVMLVTAGLIGGVAQIMVTSSYRFGAASMLAPFDYTSLIFAGILGYVLFAEAPTLNMLLGAGLVVAGGVLIIWRERQLGLRQDLHDRTERS